MSNNKHKTVNNKSIVTHAQHTISKAFTLAEVLTTLMVIGVVAALTIPNLMQNFQEMTLKKQRTVFSKKFEEGLRLMRVDDKLNTQYSTTEEFVDEMKKYFKIVQVCENDNLKNCFTPSFSATLNVSNNDGSTTKRAKTFDTNSLQTTSAILEYTNYDSNVVGLKLADGANILITYNPECIGPEAGDTHTSVTSCFGYIADVNTSKAPNTIGKDITSNMNLLPLSFQFLSKGYPEALTTSECEAAKEQYPDQIKYCGATDDKDYYAGAVVKCAAEGGRLMTKNEANELISQLFDENKNITNPALADFLNSNEDDGILDIRISPDVNALLNHNLHIDLNKKEALSSNSSRKDLVFYLAFCVK